MALITWLRGAAVGAGAMYFLDPERGRRRRARVRDQFDHTLHGIEDYARKAQRDLNNRATGLAAETRSMLRRDDADDRVIGERVRSKLGRYLSHPHAVRVESRAGRVALSGPVLADELDDLLKAVRGVRGVKGVENRLEVHDRPEAVSALQGGARSTGELTGAMQQNWNPATRAVAQILGLVLMGNCLARRDFPATLFGIGGFGLFLRGTTNQSFGQMTGMGSCPQAVGFQRTVTIGAPVDKVWELVTDFERLGQFFPEVKSVESLGGGRYRWSLALPSGQELELDERVTESVPNARLSWESVANHPVSYHGTVALQREGDDATRVNVRFEYTPPGGGLADAAASLFGMDAESKFQDAVMRIKSFLETGNPPRDLHGVATGGAAERP